jgi:hypothetical protein
MREIISTTTCISKMISRRSTLGRRSPTGSTSGKLFPARNTFGKLSPAGNDFQQQVYSENNSVRNYIRKMVPATFSRMPFQPRSHVCQRRTVSKTISVSTVQANCILSSCICCKICPIIFQSDTTYTTQLHPLS